MKCWHCNSEVVWNCDYDLGDIFDAEGIMSTFTCSNDECGATYECYIKQENALEFMKHNKPKALSKDLVQQLNWAKNSLVGKTFINNKTKGIYYVKNIVVDTETLELRVIYVDGVSVNEWDRPLLSFLKKFTEYKIGRKYE